MTISDAGAIVIAGAAPSVAALLLAFAAYVQAQANHVRGTQTAAKTADNTARLDTLENGGGDKKVIDNLATLGLVDRRGGTITPTVGPNAPPASQEANTGIVGGSPDGTDNSR